MDDQGAFTFDEPSEAEKAFRRFHHAHPNVLTTLANLAYKAKRAGRDKVGLRMLFEVVRWEWTLAGLPDEAEEFKLNNNYAPRYARLIMSRYPDLEGFFEIRRMQP